MLLLLFKALFVTNKSVVIETQVITALGKGSVLCSQAHAERRRQLSQKLLPYEKKAPFLLRTMGRKKLISIFNISNEVPLSG